MPKKGTKARPAEEAAQQTDVQPGMTLDEVREALDEALEGVRNDMADSCAQVREDISGVLDNLQSLRKDWGRELRQSLALIDGQRQDFYQRMEEILANRQGDELPQDDTMADEPVLNHEEWMQAVATAEDVVAQAMPQAAPSESGGEFVEIDENGQAVQEDIENMDEAVIRTESMIEGLMDAGKIETPNHVVNVFKNMHGLNPTPPDEA